MEAEFADAVAGWFRQLPPNTIVEWTGDGGSVVPGVYNAWVDVVILDACEALEVSWLMTFVAPGDEHAASDLVVEPDLSMWFVFGPGDVDQFVVVVGADEYPSREQLAPLEVAVAEDDTRRIIASAAWSVPVLTGALARWVAAHVGRTDLTLEHVADVETPTMSRLAAALEGEHYDFAPGIEISDMALDALLALDRDEAAQLSASMVAYLTPIVSPTDVE